jgi:hypothetical protein
MITFTSKSTQKIYKTKKEGVKELIKKAGKKKPTFLSFVVLVVLYHLSYISSYLKFISYSFQLNLIDIFHF